MDQEAWRAVDAYFIERLGLSDPALEAALAANAPAGLPPHDVSPPQGKFLNLIARMIGARRILEIGTLGAYSTIWLVRALPDDGLAVTLEIDADRAGVARVNLERAGLSDRTDIRVGPALETLPLIEEEGIGPFDLVFIDADKANNVNYLDWAIRLGRPGTVVVVDNVVRDGAVTDSASTHPSVRGTRAVFDMLATEPRLDATAIQTVGGKGWDGFVLAVLL